jgi:hypothetical protein
VAGYSGQRRWWSERGFWANPYGTKPLGLNQDDADLLVGRDRLQAELVSRLQASTAHATLAGPYGSGKTSLIRCVMRGLDQEAARFTAGQLLLPVMEPISPREDEPAHKFVKRCLQDLSVTLVRGAHAVSLAGGHVGSKVQALAECVGEPVLISRGGGASILGSGANVTRIKTANSGSGFEESGLPRLVREALKEAFPADEVGSLVACIDDLELCGGPAQVRQFLSEIREPLLTLDGVKWVIVGADDVLVGAAGHPRLTGVMSSSRPIPQLSDAVVEAVVEKRIELYHWGSEVTVPVNGPAFARLYGVSGRHLRGAFSLCMDFALHAESRGILDSDVMIRSEHMDGNGPWLQLDVPLDLIEEFLNQISLREWDRLVELGAGAAAVLEDLAAAAVVEAKVLDQGEPARRAALERLVDATFATAGVPAAPPLSGVIRLTSSGALALAGGRLAGLL